MRDLNEVSLDEALLRYDMYLVADGRSVHTRKQYRRHLQSFANWLVRAREKTTIGSIDPGDIAAYFGTASTNLRADGKRWKRATSMNTLRSSVRTFCRWMHAAAWIKSDPSALLRRAICSPPPPRSIAPADVERLLATMEADATPPARRDRLLVLMMLKTGARVSEALGIDVEDVDLARREIALHKTKGNRPAVVPFGATLARELVPAVDGQIGFLFPARNGRRMSPRQAQRRFGMWIEKAGIASATLHGLRHSFGQALFDRTGNLGLCQTALRHRSISSTTIYARASTAQVRHALCE